MDNHAINGIIFCNRLTALVCILVRQARILLRPQLFSLMHSFCTVSVNKVSSPMPRHQLKHLLEYVKAENTKIKKLHELQVPKELGGEVDIILGIAHNNIYL